MQTTWRQRLRYSFDNSMSRGPIALIGWLAVLSLAVVLVISLIVWVLGIAPGGIGATPGSENRGSGFIDIVWFSLLRTLDSGTMGGDSGRWPFLLAMLAVTFGGIFIISTFIGVLTSGIESRLDELRKGRSLVLEQDHTLILGWSSRIFTIISEIAVANENRKKPRIVVLANRDKVEMEDEIRERGGDLKNTRVICRTGDPLDLSDLAIVNPGVARSIIVLEPEMDQPDAHVIKAILALTNNPQRRETPYHVVAEISDAKDLTAAKMVGGDEVVLVVTGDLISRIIVQTSRQSGLSVVYTELMDFGGDEIYFKAEPSLAGKTFGEALLAYETSTVIGLRTAGKAVLNPPMDTVIVPGDQVIAISADDDTVVLSPAFSTAGNWIESLGIPQDRIAAYEPIAKAPEHSLILGWNKRAVGIIAALDDYVAPGSDVTVVATEEFGPDDVGPLLQQPPVNLTVSYGRANTTDRRTLDDLHITSYDQVIVLPYSDQLGVQEADARTLVTLLHLRDIATKSGTNRRIVTEMLDLRNRELAEVTGADDFIVSSRLTSLMLAQISENKELAVIFEDLLDPEGSEIYLKPAHRYVTPGEPVNFYTVTEAARRRGEIAIGYRIDALGHDASKAYGVVVNPRKTEMVTYQATDSLVLIAEE